MTDLGVVSAIAGEWDKSPCRPSYDPIKICQNYLDKLNKYIKIGDYEKSKSRTLGFTILDILLHMLSRNKIYLLVNWRWQQETLSKRR
jgi:hypothetical protein